ncbi:hypothetical protein KSD_17410 [Ktedonobacter sp. SOSP1-85]|nr:hypothetical protein KSD_17410 [Ktedonobacter sp. SOSP1-85]
MGYRSGYPCIPTLDLPLALPVGLIADEASQKGAGSGAFYQGSLDNRADARFFDMTNQKM